MPRFIQFLVVICWLAAGSLASAAALRIVTYNIDADTNGSGGVGTVASEPSLNAVLQAIGQDPLGPSGNAQPIDVLALEELSWVGSGASPTLQTIVNDLNNDYASLGLTYTYDSTYDPTDANAKGNGPCGLIYNTNTVKDLGAVEIGPVGGGTNGVPRAPMRFNLQPVGGNSSSQFYLYVSHADLTTPSRQVAEAIELRNSANTLGASANVIYTGDYNAGPGALSYGTMTSSAVSGGSVGQAIDPGINAPGYVNGLNTETDTNLQYRDDYQFITAPVANGSSGLQLVSSSYTVFGNNGTTNNAGPVAQSQNQALSYFGGNAYTLETDLTNVTDHLPVVADYTYVATVPEPGTGLMAIAGAIFLAACARRSRRVSARIVA